MWRGGGSNSHVKGFGLAYHCASVDGKHTPEIRKLSIRTITDSPTTTDNHLFLYLSFCERQTKWVADRKNPSIPLEPSYHASTESSVFCECRGTEMLRS
jgi:hypothetical protein